MSILAHNGSAVIGMSGKDCAAIACDLRFGVNLQTISTDFTKVYSLGPRLYVGFPGLATDNQTVYVFKRHYHCLIDFNVYSSEKICMNYVKTELLSHKQ
uniref:20S proteasome subunit beta 3 n=1 Tax=Schistosoma japonicum TaxID=6182 RepID=C7TY90_SCHJA|nr:20S proteasome subunit beta 3 [Schistosoma japonicum]